MPTIRVDDEVFRVLQRKGQAFVDTPNSVLRRILGLNKKTARAAPLSTGTKSPSRSRHAGVQDWLVDGRRLGTRQVSRMLAAVYREDDPKTIYTTNSPERFLDTHVADIAVISKVEAVINGEAVPLDQFVRKYPAVA